MELQGAESLQETRKGKPRVKTFGLKQGTETFQGDAYRRANVLACPFPGARGRRTVTRQLFSGAESITDGGEPKRGERAYVSKGGRSPKRITFNCESEKIAGAHCPIKMFLKFQRE